MLSNYLLTGFRHLLKNKTVSFINIIGLSLSCAAVVLISLLIVHERSFDKELVEGRNVYRVELSGLGTSSVSTGDFLSNLVPLDLRRTTSLAPDLVPEIVRNIPTIKKGCRLLNLQNYVVTTKHGKVLVNGVLKADSMFFDILQYHFVSRQDKILTDSRSVVITKSTAERLFENQDGLGQTIEISINSKEELFSVSAIVEDPPVNSSLQFSMVIPLHHNSSIDRIPARDLSALFTFGIIETDESSIESVKHALDKFGKSYYQDALAARNISPEQFSIALTPYQNTHLDNIPYGWPNMGRAWALYFTSIIAFIFISIAALNYSIIEITRRASRGQEVGMRKSYGASRLDIAWQFWAETLLLTSVSMVAGVILAYLILPYFADLLDSAVSFQSVHPALLIGAIVLQIALITVVIGAYPAMFMAGKHPSTLLRAFGSMKINTRFAGIVVCTQYVTCFILITALLVIHSQMEFITGQNLGFERKNILSIDMFDNQTYDNSARLAKELKARLASLPVVHAIAGGDIVTNPGIKLIKPDAFSEIPVLVYTGDFDYPDVMQFCLVAGRFPDANVASDTLGKGSVVINETLARILGEKARLGYPCRELEDAIVIGVVKDFHGQSLMNKIGPCLFKISTEAYTNILISTSAEGDRELSDIMKVWANTRDGDPLIYQWLDDLIDAQYGSQNKWASIINLSTFAAIIIAATGLFGLTGLSIVNRYREIGIRTTLGASTTDVLLLLNKDIIRFVLLSYVISIPLAVIIMSNWLSVFAYKVSITSGTIIQSGLIGFVICVATVSYYSIKALSLKAGDILRT